MANWCNGRGTNFTSNLNKNLKKCQIGLIVGSLFRMRMLVERCILCSIINIQGILGGWLPLDCSNPRPSNPERQLGGPCLRGINVCSSSASVNRSVTFFTSFWISSEWQKPNKKKSLSLTKSGHHPHFKVLPLWTISVFLLIFFLSLKGDVLEEGIT